MFISSGKEEMSYSFSEARLSVPRGLQMHLISALKALRSVPREELSPIAACLEDQGRFLMKEAEALQNTLKACPRLPASGKIPRILQAARELVRREEGLLSADLILRFFREYPSETEWEHEELCHLFPALSCALMEEIDNVTRFCREEAHDHALARKMERRITANTFRTLPDNPGAVSALFSLLTAHENTRGLTALEKAAKGRLSEITDSARQEITLTEHRMRQCLQSLRLLQRLPFQGILERLSPVCALLRQEETYRLMDEESRNHYLSCVCRIARKNHIRASSITRAAISLTEGKTGAEKEAGYYLLERPDLIEAYLFKRTGVPFFQKHRQGTYAALLLMGALFFPLVAFFLHMPLYSLPLILLCGTEYARRLLFPLYRKRFPPRMLPRIDKRHLPRDQKLLITVPSLLLNRKQVFRLFRHLGVLKTAAPDADILLLGDFADSEQETQPSDEELLSASVAALQALNSRYQGGFFLLQRKRVWDPGQDRFTGRERKRGALEMLNHLILGEEAPDDCLYASFSPEEIKERYAYVLTLDADTFLPPEAADKLMGAMAHPLQKGRVGVIQPRMETAPDRVRTRVQKYLGGFGGVDPYGSLTPDLYQDVFGRGSFVGKGIYAPALWMERLRGKVPPGRLLSHDLFEGERVGSALAQDIVLYDGHPSALSGWQKRLHRWTRGDWQLLPSLHDRSFDLLSRLKMWDNLRRSLMAFAQCILLLISAALGSPLLFLFALPFPIRGMGMRLMLLPGKALTQADAILRALYRLFISKKLLLSWVTAEQAESGKGLPSACLFAQLILGALMMVLSLLPYGFLPAVWVGILWVLSPLTVPFLDRPLCPEKPMTEKQKSDARALARDTWRYFDTTVSENTHFLPPDNLQIEPDRGLAMRTSPTNIGLYLLSCAAARKLNLISTAQMARRMENTVSVLEKMEKWHGHLYNWYALDDPAPLPPRFVSTVDSGNFCAFALTCAQICRQYLPEMEEALRSLPVRLDALASGADFSVLLDPVSGLFSIGYDCGSGRLSAAHYDLMASEARTASYIAVMQRQIPLSHWKKLNRSRVRPGGGALVSWGGTLFEYLMPGLVLPLLPGTLIGEGCKSAVRAQMAHAGSRPFGVSESGYYAFDPDLNYQYQAFGLPALAHSGEITDHAVAPYASLLALPYFPRAAALNISRMEKMGWKSELGFFEAADYTPQRFGRVPRLVMSHMAHHQGMILCSLCNALTDFSLVRAFMTPPDAQAYASLLWEKLPPLPGRARVLPPPRLDPSVHSFPGRFPHPGFPLEAHALFGSGVTWVLSAHGDGYLSANGMMISRFFENAEAPSGFQLYLRDEQTGAFIRPMQAGKTRFESGKVRFEGEALGLRYSVICSVTPIKGIAVASLLLENGGKTEKETDAISFLEIAQGSRKADAAHRNYRDLSVQVGEWKNIGLFSRRLSGDEKDQMPLVFHAVTGDGTALRRQGDRRLFLGRSGGYENPAQLHHSANDCVFRTGDVLAPCLSLRTRVILPPHGKAALHFYTFVCSDLNEAEDRILKKEMLPGQWALCTTQAQMALRFLHMDASLMPCCHQMLGALVFSGQPHQMVWPPAPRSALWALGISCDLPILLISLEKPDRILTHHVLKIYRWMRAQGVWVDAVFFCRDEKEYLHPIRDSILRLAAENLLNPNLSVPGGIHVLSGTREQEEALSAHAGLHLQGGIPLQRQLAALRIPENKQKSLIPDQPMPLVPPSLRYFNGFGGFAENGSYWVSSPPPVPWHHILPGRSFGTLVSESGILQSFGENSRLSLLTRPAYDVHAPQNSEEIYLRDDRDHLYPLARCAARFSPGLAEYRTRCGGITCELSVFTCPDRGMGIRHLVLRSEKECTLRLYVKVRFSMDEGGSGTFCRIDGNRVLASSGEVHKAGWAAAEDCHISLCASGELQEAFLSDTEETKGDTAIFCHSLSVRAREPNSFTWAVGMAADEETAQADYACLIRSGAPLLLRDCLAFWQKKTDALLLFGGSTPVSLMLNTWLPYQVRASRLMARMGPYQIGGAFGFRDQLQDLLALLHTDPASARDHILLCAAHQYPEGDVQHWWHPPQTGVRTRISDDKLFLPYLTALYVQITGDQTILEEKIPYLFSSSLSQLEEERYETPETTDTPETLFSHCLRAIDSVALGSHGLPLMGNGDWNDGMNRIGGRSGESVWLGFFLAYLLKAFLPLCPPEEKERLSMLRRKLLDHGEHAWSGKWYLRAWNDQGEPIGGPESAVIRIDLISQCFACLAGAPREHAREAVYHAVDQLYDRDPGTVRLLSPPFSPEEKAGYIGAYLPGVRENGGQYTHAVPWLIMALCELGENDLAWEIAESILPIHHGSDPKKIRVYELEPYVLCGDVYAGQNAGRGGWSWYTGSAAWLYYVFITVLLGFEKRGDQARLLPAAKRDMDEYTLVYRFGDAQYHFTASRDALFPTLDGERIQDGWVHMTDDGKTHEARFPLK